METATAWHRALHDPQLQGLPYKIETNEHGQLLLSPHKPHHSLQQGRLVSLFDQHAQRAGRAAVEFAVATNRGVKVPDVVWISDDRLAQIPDDAEASSVLPEIVVEVLSESNTASEIEEKRRLYFDEGADEVWTCDPDGEITFYSPDGEIEQSALISSFPTQIE